MKKSKISVVEKKLIRVFLIILVIQAIAIISFIRLIDLSHLDAEDIKCAEIVVEGTSYIRITKHYWLIVDTTDTNRYVFPERQTTEEYSTSQLNASISRGDRLTIKYREEYSILGKSNFVVDARTENKIYRSLEEYIRGKKGTNAVIITSFAILELIFLSFVTLFVWTEHKTVKLIRGRFCD